MAGVFKTVTFVVLVFAAVVVFAEDYDVGDDTEWTRPMDAEFYTTWAAGKTFRVGDELGEYSVLSLFLFQSIFWNFTWIISVMIFYIFVSIIC